MNGGRDESYDGPFLGRNLYEETGGQQLFTPQQPLHQGSLFGEPAFRELCQWHDEMDLSSNRIDRNTRDSRRSYIRQAVEWLHREGITHPEAGDWLGYQNWRLSPQCPNQVVKSTWNSHRKVLSAVYEFCRRAPKRGWGPIPNPLHNTQVPPLEVDRQMPRCMAEPYVTYPRIQAALPDIRWKAASSTLFWMGLRIQELIAIPLPGSPLDAGRNLLDLDRGQLTIAKQRDTGLKEWEDLKTGYSFRVLQIPPEPLELIREALKWKRQNDLNPSAEWRKLSGFVHENYLFPYWRKQLEQVMDIHREVAPGDFPQWERGQQSAAAYHVYRHTFATCYARNAMDLGEPEGVWKEEIHRMLGHADMVTTDAYLRALRMLVVKTKSMQNVWAAQQERMRQAVEERSGKGLLLVKNGESKR